MIYKNYSWLTLWWTNIAMENHHILWENPLFLWPFSIAMLVHQRVSRIITCFKVGVPAGRFFTVPKAPTLAKLGRLILELGMENKIWNRQRSGAGWWFQPLWKIWVRQWEGWHPIYEMENQIHVPNFHSHWIAEFTREAQPTKKLSAFSWTIPSGYVKIAIDSMVI